MEQMKALPLRGEIVHYGPDRTPARVDKIHDTYGKVDLSLNHEGESELKEVPFFHQGIADGNYWRWSD